MSGVPRTASMVANSVSMSTPLRNWLSVTVMWSSSIVRWVPVGPPASGRRVGGAANIRSRPSRRLPATGRRRRPGGGAGEAGGRPPEGTAATLTPHHDEEHRHVPPIRRLRRPPPGAGAGRRRGHWTAPGSPPAPAAPAPADVAVSAPAIAVVGTARRGGEHSIRAGVQVTLPFVAGLAPFAVAIGAAVAVHGDAV